MRKSLLNFALTFFYFSNVFSQELSINKQKNENIEVNDNYTSLIPFVNGYICFGNKVIPDRSGDLHIYHFDNDFNFISEKTLGSSGAEVGPLAIIRNDTIFVTIQTTGSISGDLTEPDFPFIDTWVLALDLDFNILWQKVFGGDGSDQVRSIISLRNGNILLLASSSSGISGNKTVGKSELVHVDDPWLIEIKSSTGAIIKQQAITNDNDSETMYSLTQSTTTGQIYVGLSVTTNINSYFVSPTFGDGDFFVTIFNENLDKIEDRSFGGTAGEGSNIVYHDGYFYLYGSSSSGISGNKTSASFGSLDAWLIKTDENLNVIFDKSYGGSSYEYFTNILFKENRLVLAGASNSPISGNKTCDAYGLSDIWVLILDMDGNIINQNSYGGSEIDIITSILENTNNDLIVLSYSESPISGNKTENSVDNDLWLLELETTTTLNYETLLSNKLNVLPYPNPFKNAITFDFTGINDELTLRVFSLDGKQLFEKELSAQSTFTWDDISLRNQVLYYTVVGSKTNVSGKIVKN